jgi:hypothetical protein
MQKGLLCAVVLGTLSSAAIAQPPASEPACGRECLEGFIDRYLEAMRTNEVDPELFARETKFTENGIRLPLGGEGLWYGMTGIGGYKFYVPDIETQQVAFIGTVIENMANGDADDGEGNFVAVAIRLKVENELITEVEQLAIRPAVNLFGGEGGGGPFGNTGDNVEAMGEPHEIYREAIPEADRASREELVEAANHYFTGLARNDSQGYYPFTDDCIRYENGILVTRDFTCKEQFENGSLNNVVSRIRDRRFVAVDRERGIVYSFAFFDHHQINWTWQLAELFKIENGQIRRIEAVFHQAPFGIPSGWSTYEQAMSESIQSVR